MYTWIDRNLWMLSAWNVVKKWHHLIIHSNYCLLTLWEIDKSSFSSNIIDYSVKIIIKSYFRNFSLSLQLKHATRFDILLANNFFFIWFIVIVRRKRFIYIMLIIHLAWQFLWLLYQLFPFYYFYLVYGHFIVASLISTIVYYRWNDSFVDNFSYIFGSRIQL